MTYTDSININHIRENPSDPSSAIVYNKTIIKKVIKLGAWRFDLAST